MSRYERSLRLDNRVLEVVYWAVGVGEEFRVEEVAREAKMVGVFYRTWSMERCCRRIQMALARAVQRGVEGLEPVEDVAGRWRRVGLGGGKKWLDPVNDAHGYAAIHPGRVGGYRYLVKLARDGKLPA